MKDIYYAGFVSDNLFISEGLIDTVLDEITLVGFENIPAYSKYLLSKYTQDYDLYSSITLMDIYKGNNNVFPENLLVRVQDMCKQKVKDYNSNEYENKVGMIGKKINLKTGKPLVEVDFHNNPKRLKNKPVSIPIENLNLL